MLNLSSLSTQSLASCVNYFVWNCLTCFSNTKIGSVTSFSILFNFQGPVRRSLAADDLIILPQKWFFVKHFFEKLLNFSELKSFSSFSVLTVSLSGWDPSILLSQDRSVCLNAPLGRFIAFAIAKLLNVHWFFSRASCWDFRSHSFVSALGAQV